MKDRLFFFQALGVFVDQDLGVGKGYQDAGFDGVGNRMGIEQ